MIDGPGGAVWLLIAVFAGFFMDWLAVAFHWEKIKPFSKITAMILLILWTLTVGNWQVDLLLGLLLLAQGFGLAGDVFLLFSERWFMWGLGAFLAGNLLYISLLAIRFSEALQSQSMPDLISRRLLLSLIVWGLVMGAFYFLIYIPVKRKTFISSFGTAVQIYVLILSFMVAFSLLLALNAPHFAGYVWALPIGSALFVFSDAILAYNRFIKKVFQGQLWVRIAYHLAQFSLAAGFLAVIAT